MIDYRYPELFQNDSVDKQIEIRIAEYTNNPITNNDIKLDSFKIVESICSDNTIVFGKCESCHIEFDLRKDYPTINGKGLVVTLTPEGGTSLALGYYTVTSETPQTNSNYKKIVAYDNMYFINNLNVTDWWNALPDKTTVVNAVASFFEAYSIPYVRTILSIDGMEISKSTKQTNVSGADFLRSVCELEGVFGHIDRNGYFDWIRLDTKALRLYPSNTLFPSDSTIPNQKQNSGVSTNLYESVEYENYIVQPIDGVAVDCSDGTVTHKAFDTSENIYKVKANLLLQEATKADALYYAQNLYDHIYDVKYRPIKKLSSKGNPLREVGDFVSIADADGVDFVDTYILTRTITGIVALSDEIVSKGTEEQPAVQNMNQSQTQRVIEQQTVRIEKTTTEIERLQTQITTMQTQIQTLISAQLKIAWVSSASAVGSDPYTFYCVPK